MKMTAMIAVCAIAVAAAAPARADGWMFNPDSKLGPSLEVEAAGKHRVHYDFWCNKDHLVAGQVGARELMDLKTGATVPDTGLATLPTGAAVMALLTERTPEVTNTSSPGFVPAKALANPTGGWDLLISVPMDDPAVKALWKAKGVSLMSTGYTTLLMLDAKDHAALAAFHEACKSR